MSSVVLKKETPAVAVAIATYGLFEEHMTVTVAKNPGFLDRIVGRLVIPNVTAIKAATIRTLNILFVMFTSSRGFLA